MEVKLTLKLDREIIEKAKVYSNNKNISLSKIVEKYFRTLTDDDKKNNADYAPIVKEISGVINMETEYNHKKEYTDYLIEKYK